MSTSLLTTDWRQHFSLTDNIDIAWNNFKYSFHALVLKFTPLKQASNSCHASLLPPNILRLIKYKRSVRRRYSKNKCADNRQIFYRLAKTVRSSINAFRNAQEENILVSGSIKKFFNCARSRMHPSHRIGPIKRPDGTTTLNDTERAGLFNKFVHIVFAPDDGNSPLFRFRTDRAMLTPIFSVTDIRKSLTASSTSVSYGPDGIFPLFLKKFPKLCSPLCDLFNMSLQQGCVPKAWKTAYIVQIYKGKGSTLEVNNYRPISLTNFFL